MLIDEILAVGDIKFQKKCLNKIDEIRKRGTTIVFVTHNIEQAKQLCDNVLWIDDGIIREYGPSNDVCEHYKKVMMDEDWND